MSFTESVYLDAVSPDGKTAIVTRLARHVDEGVAWLWLHVFSPETNVAFVRDDLELIGGPTIDSASGAQYTLDVDAASAHFERSGDKSAPSRAEVDLHLFDQGVRLTATFHPTGPAGSNLPGRTEVLGRVEATLTTPSGRVDVTGLGQFHEQHQTTPRFQVPFTYGTLRGDDLGLVFLIGPRGSTAFVRMGEDVSTASRVRIDPVGAERSLDLELDTGGRLRVDVTRTHHYLVPLNGHPRDSSIVAATAMDLPVSGCINDWQPRR